MADENIPVAEPIPVTTQKAEDYTSRKFILVLIAVAQVSIAFWTGRLGSLEWMIFLGSSFLGYGALNLLADLLKKNITGGTK